MNALSIRSLSKTYKNGVQALKGIDLEVHAGDFFGLLGPNGAGKSTAIGVIATLIRKSAGSVSIFGHDIDRSPAEAKACLGLVPQEFNFNQFEPTVEIVVNHAGYHGIPRDAAYRSAEKYLRQLGLWDKRRTVARELSGGMKRRLMIARALAHEPKLLILDEPTAGVDIELRRSMWDFLRRINSEGITIILTTHYLEEAETLCRNIAIIDEGVLIENASTRTLLDKLHVEIFILYLRKPLEGPLSLPGYDITQLDPGTLEVSVSRETDLNRLFALLTASGIEVASMRNKANRLEELFLRLVNGKNLPA
jgi:ABC-2 type transport system ATP-binding protein